MTQEYLVRKKNVNNAFVSTIYTGSISHSETSDGAMKFDDEVTAKCIAKHCEKVNGTPYIVLVRTTTLTEIPEDDIKPEE